MSCYNQSGVINYLPKENLLMTKMKGCLFFNLCLFLIILQVLVPGRVQAASKVKLNKTSLSLRYGRYTFLKVKGTTKKVKWSSTRKSVVHVTAKGKVTASGHGTATVKAKVRINRKYRTLRCKVTVPYTFANDSLRDRKSVV